MYSFWFIWIWIYDHKASHASATFFSTMKDLRSGKSVSSSLPLFYFLVLALKKTKNVAIFVNHGFWSGLTSSSSLLTAWLSCGVDSQRELIVESGATLNKTCNKLWLQFLSLETQTRPSHYSNQCNLNQKLATCGSGPGLGFFFLLLMLLVIHEKAESEFFLSLISPTTW